MLRQYRFHDGGLFDLRLFHYSDVDCRSPSYSLTARGHYRPYQTSWIVAGATEMDYQTWHVGVVPYRTSVVYGLRRRLAMADDDDGSCARHVAALPWQTYEKREIYTRVDAAYDAAAADPGICHRSAAAFRHRMQSAAAGQFAKNSIPDVCSRTNACWV